MSADDIMRLLRSAVSAVLGASVADDQPLVEAGLDSLGDTLLFLCASSDMSLLCRCLVLFYQIF